MKKLILLIVLALGPLLSSQAALTWHWVSLPSDATIQAQIASAMNSAVATYNTYSDYTGDIPVTYNSGVPTAQTDGYMGWIEFGGSISYRVAMHEMCHWLGTGTAGNWSSFNGGGVWGGTYGNSAIQSYDGPTATIGCDSMHFWPYNWNYDSEQAYPERLVGMVGALRRDMGLSDMTLGYAPGTYRLRNRSSVKLLDCGGAATDGAPVKQYAESGSANQQWVLSLISGTKYFTLRSVGNGKLLDSLGNTNDGAAVGLMTENFTTSQQWQIVATDSGFYKLINRATGKCLDTGGQVTDGTGMQSWYNATSANQEWKFVHPTLATIPAGLLSQYRPTAASSYAAGNLPGDATDGKTTVTRWTANGGSYPQWWRVDLGAICNLTNIITYWYPGWTFLYRIETSSDDVNYTTAVDATANTVVGYTTNSLSATARYVRITTTGIAPSGGWASFFDCQVFGTPALPAAPTGLVAAPVSSRQINLGWADKGGVASYNVKRATASGGPYTTIATGVKGISYSDTGLADSTTYYYVVSAANSSGESANSAPASATTPAPAVPLAPTGLTAMPGHNQVALNWAVSSEAAGYNVKRATASTGPFSTLATPTATTYTDTTAVNGATYYYVVSATNAAGESANSVQVVATPTAMLAHWKFNETGGTLALDSVAGRSGTLQSAASWAAGKLGNSVSLDGTSGYVSLPSGLVSTLNDFSVAAWVYVDVNSTWARVFDFGSSTTVYMYLAPLSGGNTLRYAITTSSSGGEQTLNGPALSPGAWHHVAVTLSGALGKLYVDGIPVGTNSSMTLKPSSLGSTTQNYLGKSQWSDPYLNGRVDDFRLYSRALSAAELVALSNPDGAPPAPANLVAAPGHNQVALNWTPLTGALGYNVKRASVSGGPYTTIATPSTFNYTDTTALNSLTYYYVVSALNAAGEGTNSAPVAVTPSDLLAYWKFNESAGTTAADSAGANPGTLAPGASWAAGRVNNAVSLNGSSGYVSFPAGLVSSLTDFSVSTWVYLNANSSWARLFDFGTGTGTYMFLAPASGSSTLRYAITIAGGSAEQQINGSAVLAPGYWHQVAVTLSGTTGTLYVDGAAVGTNSSMTLTPSSLGSTTQNYLGKSQFSDPYLNGRVDDFRLYRRALSAAEVSTLFTSGGAVPASPASVTANPGDGQVSLSWNTSASATSYKVKRSTTSGGPFTTLTTPAASAWTDLNVANGTRYYYVVSAVNISGESANSPQAVVTPSSTAPVSALMARSEGALSLSWPADHTGWRLQSQTNSLATGLGTNWFEVPGSTETNSLSLPVDWNNASVFYRLVYP